jgi:hypothetical protein
MEDGGEDPVAGVVEAAAAGQRPLRFDLGRAAAVGVAGDHLAAVDAEPRRHLGRRGDAAAEDRRGGDVGPELRAQQPVDRLHPRREGGTEGAPAQPPAAVATVLGAGEQAPGRLGGTASSFHQPGRPDLGHAPAESIYGAQHALVVGWFCRVGDRAGDPHHGRGGEALGAGQGQVRVHVMAVGGIDVLAQPKAGVGEAQLGAAEPIGDLGGRAGGGVVEVLEAQWAGAAERELVEQRLGEAVVVVAGDEHDLAPGERFAELFEERSGGAEGDAEGKVAQLDRVAEDDQPVGLADLLQQRPPDRRLAQHVLAVGAAEVEVGDDRRPHPHLLQHRFGQSASPGTIPGCG